MSFCESIGIKQRFTSVEHPQSNGQAELANQIILEGLKKRLSEAKGRWADELPNVLWSYRMTPQTATREMPFKLTYGCEAMIPVEVGQPFDQQKSLEKMMNDQRHKEDLGFLLEICVQAHLQNEKHKALIARIANKRIKLRSFPEGTLVLG